MKIKATVTVEVTRADGTKIAVTDEAVITTGDNPTFMAPDSARAVAQAGDKVDYRLRSAS